MSKKHLSWSEKKKKGQRKKELLKTFISDFAYRCIHFFYYDIVFFVCVVVGGP